MSKANNYIILVDVLHKKERCWWSVSL